MLNDFVPSVAVELSYPSKHKVVDLGNSIKPKHVTSEPVFTINTIIAAPTPTQKANATYVLALTDPDATSRSDPAKAQMCHWIATNITLPLAPTLSMGTFQVLSLTDISGVSDSSGIFELMSYIPPTPPPKTGYHRYIFVVLAPKQQDRDMELKKPNDRSHWGYGKVGAGVREWAEANDLVAVGKSAAGR